jgi:putative NIF3 family GTP cyclohydrolase 1 type 2
MPANEFAVSHDPNALKRVASRVQRASARFDVLGVEFIRCGTRRKPLYNLSMIHLDEIAFFLDRTLEVTRYADEQHGVFHTSARTVRRLGLALEPSPGLRRWAAASRLDAVFLHRPWRLEPDQLAPDVGVLAYHLSFDEHLTLGYNERLAIALGVRNVEVLGTKEGRPLGMIGDTDRVLFAAFERDVWQVFGGLEGSQRNDRELQRVAVVGAMNHALVREAAERGADVYITGQYRQPARVAVAETGIGVLEVGHRRSEVWGLRALAGILRERWAMLEVVLPHDG